MRSLSPGREAPLRISKRNVKDSKDSGPAASSLHQWFTAETQKEGRAAYSATLVRLVARLGVSLGLGCSLVTNWTINRASLKSFASSGTQYDF